MRKMKTAFGCLVTACLLAVCLKGLTDIMERKGSDFKYRPFFEQEADFDVLFFGTSHVINGIFPMELWKDYGIVSYNFGGHGNAIATSYWVMKNALDYTKPRLVVLDCLMLGSETKTSGSFDQVHLSLDTFPFSITKCRAARDLLQDDKISEYAAAGSIQDMGQRTKMSLLWDYSIYHSRWNELAEADFNHARSREKGAESRIAVSRPGEVPFVPAGRKLEGETAGVSYLRKLIQECQSRGIEVLLLYLPFPAPEGSQMEANWVLDIADEYGVRYINFLNMDLVDYDTDCYDPASHLNPSGARKVTDYLGRYISKYYDVKDRRGEAPYAGWQDDYADYEAFKAENLKNQTAPDVYLMLLADKNYDALIEVQNPAVFKSGYYMRLLGNLGIHRGGSRKNADCFFVQGSTGHVDYLDGFGKRKGIYRTKAGVLENTQQEDGNRAVMLDGEVLYSVPQEGNGGGMHITVFDHDSGEVIDQVGVVLQGKEDLAQDYVGGAGIVR